MALQVCRCLSKYVSTNVGRKFQGGICSTYRLIGFKASRRTLVSHLGPYGSLRVSSTTGGLPFRGFHFTVSVCNGKIVDVEGPTFPESISEGDIRWTKKKGDFVKEDEVVAEIETDKTNIEVPASSSGIIEELLVADGSKVTSRQLIYKIRLADQAPLKPASTEAKPEPSGKTEPMSSASKRVFESRPPVSRPPLVTVPLPEASSQPRVIAPPPLQITRAPSTLPPSLPPP
ncbi:unnamed protein product, partial [Soboliphyme baturini]|uniref:Lipoyl-binding domain-containing protein n=1 Tax=Soboliphyme baturini TaxID=241478 RepID=A0A183IBI6_9BILA